MASARDRSGSRSTHGPLSVTLHGVSQPWLDQFAGRELLAAPTRGFDGGDPIDAAANWPHHDNFEPITLAPGDERVIGIELRMTDAVAFACEHWMEGGGIVWDGPIVEWSWLFARHEQEFRFEAPIEFTAPSAADCDA